MLTKPQVFYDNNLKQALGFQNPFYLKKVQQIRRMLYDDNVIANETNVISIADSEETLMLVEESRSKMFLKQSDPMVLEKKVNIKLIDYAELNRLSEDFGKCFVLQRELSDEQALHPIIDQSASSFVKIEAPQELPKVIMVNISLEKLKYHLSQFDNVVKKQITPNALTEGEWGSYKQDIVNIVVHSSVDMNTSVKVNSSVIMNDSVNYMKMCNKCLELEAELIKQHNMVEKDEYNRLSKRFSELEQHCISLKIAMQLNKEIFQKTNTSVNQTEPSFDQLFELNNLKAELQAKDTTIKKLKTHIKRNNETSTSESVKKDFDEIETINIELEHRVTRLIAKNEHLKQTYKQLYDSIKPSRVYAKEQTESLVNQVNQQKLKGNDTVDNAAQMSNATTMAPGMYKLDPIILAPQVKNNRETHEYYLKHTIEQAAILRVNGTRYILGIKYFSCSILFFSYRLPVVQIILWYLDSGCSKHMIRDGSQLSNFVHKFLGTVKFGNDQVAKIIWYGGYQIGNVTISRVYYVEGLGHNLFLVGQFCDSDLEVAFRKHTCFVRNLEGVDLLLGPRGTNLYSLSIGDIMASSPICLLLKAAKTKSWLWHRRLSYLNFGAIYHSARHGLVRSLPRIKFEKDHLYFAYDLGKSKKQSHKLKSEDTNQEKLYLLHMDLCRPMRIASVNGKKYILVIVADYSRFTWVNFLASKDEAPDFIIKFLKMIQVRLNAIVRNIHTDNRTKFVNQTLRDYYEQVGISHETSVA
ncbi:retrovirus-related pol polyprotein from transposon TNT 1-94 [Tanacetum coccineum]